MDYDECAVSDCSARARIRGWCNPHYQRWYSHGDPEWAPPSAEERFWARVNKTDSCWLWAAHINNSGYGWTGKALAHRKAYELTNGAIPDGMDLDHLCRVRSCCNPGHLEPVSHRKNVLRGMAPGSITFRTNICKRGHALTGANVYVVPKTGHRRCLACVALRKKARAAR